MGYKISIKQMMNEINRNHLEGTINAPKWSPTDGWFATPCMHDNSEIGYRTAASMVVHLNKEKPPMLKSVYWASFSRNNSCSFCPCPRRGQYIS